MFFFINSIAKGCGFLHKYLKLSRENVKISQENTSNYYQKRLIKIFKKLNAKK